MTGFNYFSSFVATSDDEMHDLRMQLLDDEIAKKAKMKEILTADQYSKWEKNDIDNDLALKINQLLIYKHENVAISPERKEELAAMIGISEMG